MHTLRRVLTAGAASALLVLGGAVLAPLAQAQPAGLFPGDGKTAQPIDLIGPVFAVPAEGVDTAGGLLSGALGM
ncbi:hypothetical protein GCM10010145_61290 [Streptomyces ruber]|uniref:Secreted protein n=2 Tax=Streptomyces TaxID=1883 RepID=A0A918BR79_9ACTN|nr:hypothetical protein GCM10010145_61290 [Streptomyces ruber]